MPSLNPIIGPDPRVLILGSMPSVTSLKNQQYYAHPQNAFWWIMSELLGARLDTDYLVQVEHVKQFGIAIWDVLYDCEREGSLDSNIVRESETANNIIGLLNKHQSIRLVGFNGGTAKAIFKRHFKRQIEKQASEKFDKLRFVQLPSTSPAHASLSKTEKLDVWRAKIASELS